MTFAEIIDKEREMLLTAEEHYGEYYTNCFNFVTLMQGFVTEGKPKAWIFALFLSQSTKHLVLSFFSVLRRHRIQAMMDLRQVHEAGAKGAYSIAFPDESKFVQAADRGTIREPKRLPKECYGWLENNYQKQAASLKEMKQKINENYAHANAVMATQTYNMTKKGFEFTFFDKEDTDLVRADLWIVGNTAMGIMDLFYGVNQDRNIITFSPDFVTRLKNYEAVGTKLKDELLSKERFK